MRKNAESAMATFLPIEDLKNPLIILKLFKDYGKGNLGMDDRQITYVMFFLFRMVLKNFDTCISLKT